MASLITQVKSSLFISSARPSTHLLDGAYASLLHARSMDFDDLRRYEIGDQVRDIDWRASARLGDVMIKRTRAARMHTVTFVVDTGRTMAALAADDLPKSEMSVLAAGVLGWLTVAHGDEVALVYGDADGVHRTARGRGEAALERLLRTVRDATAASRAPGSIDALLAHVAATLSRSGILVVITDEAPTTAEMERLVGRLRMQHDIVWLTVADADPVLEHAARTPRRDVMSAWQVPDFVHGDDAVRAEWQRERAAENAARDALLDRWAISRTALRTQADTVGVILALLDRRSRVRHR